MAVLGASIGLIPIKMHELSLCQDIVRALEQAAVRERFSRILRVRLEIGALAGVEVDALRFGFRFASKGTVAQGAELVIRQAPGRAWCDDCGHEVEIPDRLSGCPVCGGYGLRVTGGAEMKINDVEVA